MEEEIESMINRYLEKANVMQGQMAPPVLREFAAAIQTRIDNHVRIALEDSKEK